MSCVIDGNVTSIEFNKSDGKWWIIQSDAQTPIKVKNLADCKFLPSAKDRKISIQAVDTQDPQPQPQSQPLLEREPPIKNGVLKMEPTDLSEVQNIMNLAGDSVWGGVAIFAMIMLFKYLNKKMEMESKTSEDLSKQCESRHTDINVKVDSANKELASLEKRISTLELEFRYAPRSREDAPHAPPRRPHP